MLRKPLIKERKGTGMARFSPGILGLGTVISGVSLVLRPFHDGYRIYVNHGPCTILPFGGYVRSVAEAERTVQRYKHKILSFA